MPTLLLTAFEPFGGSTVNPSQRVLEVIEREGVEGVELRTLVHPVEGGRAARLAVAALARLRPEFVVSLGESGRSTAIAVERVALNLRDYAIADNAGRRVRDRPVVRGGPDAIFSTLPVRAMVEAIERAGVPAIASLSAGTFLCNEVMYAVLHAAREAAPRAAGGAPIRAGFVHVPQLPEQVAGGAMRTGPLPSMALDVSLAGIRAALAVVARRSGRRSATITCDQAVRPSARRRQARPSSRRG